MKLIRKNKQGSLFSDDTPEIVIDPTKPLPKVTVSSTRRKRSNDCKIFYKDDSPQIQRSLLSPLAKPFPPGTFPPTYYPNWDNTDTDSIGFSEAEKLLAGIVSSAAGGTLLGLDFEFYPETLTPTIVGIATPTAAYSCRWSDALIPVFDEAVKRGVRFSGHFVLGADRLVLEKKLGYTTPVETWDDSMIRHYLCYASLCKNPGAKVETEGALGFMGLGTAAHLWLSIPMWKNCRGIYCVGPCPRHSVHAYCAIDAWAGLMISLKAKDRMVEIGIPEVIFGEHSYLASEFCLKAQFRGIQVDTARLAETDKLIEEAKEALFPVVDGKYEKFNPKSNKQVLEYFQSQGFYLADNTKDTIFNHVQLIAEDAGFESVNQLISAPEPVQLSSLDQTLVDLYIYKNSGKGTESWFGEKYLDKSGKVHSRFNFTGTATLRYSSSAPNFQNIAARGWGVLLKRLVIPSSSDKILLSADASNLEARNCFHYAGIDVTTVGDVFTWLVDNSGGILEKVALELYPDPTKELAPKMRAVAKTVFHATNYLVGLVLLDDAQLAQKHTKDLEKAGALLIFRDWKFFGKTVAFTGSKLAQMVFKNKTNESRKKILDLQAFYFNAYPEIREWHRRVLREIELTHAVKTAWGTYLELLDDPLKMAKSGVAKLGQGSGAEFVQGKMYEYCKMYPEIPMIAQVHDEIIWEIPKSWDELTILKFCDILTTDSHRIPGFRTPWTVKIGENWGSRVLDPTKKDYNPNGLNEIKKNFTGTRGIV